MARYVAKRLVITVVTLGVVALIVFTVLFVLPGDPAQLILGIQATPEKLESLRAQLGLHKPFWVQFGEWIWGLVTLTGSRSIAYDVPVAELIISRMAVTGPLAVMAMVVAVGIAFPLGIYAARHQNRAGDLAVMGFTQIGLATPEFWLGILLILFFAVKIGWFSAGGFPGWNQDFWGSLKALLLPAFALGVIRAAVLARLTRSSMLDVLKEDFVRTARAKGLKERTVIYSHALRNALIPIVTIMGLQLGQLLAGAIIIENVFYLPGLGRLVFQAIGQRDLPVVREVVLVMAAMVILVNFIVDLLYTILDPRIRVE